MNKVSFSVLLSLVWFGCATKAPQVPPVEAPVVSPAPTAEVKPDAAPEETEEPVLKYSEMNNMAPPTDRNYRRMTRQRMEEEAELQADAGSLWKMEGQTSYLFSQNKHRQSGDPTAIKMEGPALKFVEGKVAVIMDLLSDLEKQKIEAEAQRKVEEEAAAKEKARLAEIDKMKAEMGEELANEVLKDPYAGQYPVDPATQVAAAREPAAKKEEPAKAKEEKIDLKDIENIPSRIVEKTPDGMYRIRGQQFLTIKKRNYKVIATALVRADDFDDATISSNKLLDAQYDVIHVKRTE